MLTGFERPLRILSIFLGRSGVLPAEIKLRRNGWRFRVRSAMDVWIVKETCLDEDYFWATAVTDPEWIVVDIGAGIGDFTVFAADRCSAGQVFSFEPLEDSFLLLKENVAINGLSNVHALHLAVASKDGVMEADSTAAEAVSTRFQPSAAGSGVSALSISGLLDMLPGGKCDFMKIDCEGCEFDIIRNSPPGVLSRIARISLEYHATRDGGKLQDLVNHLEAAGFLVHMRANPVHATLGFLYAELASPAT